MTVNSTPGGDGQTLWIATDRTVYRGQLEPIFVMANATDADELADYLNALESRALAAEAALRDAEEALRAIVEPDVARPYAYSGFDARAIARAALNRPTAAREEETNG